MTTIRQLSRQSGNSSSLKNSTRYWAGRDFICGLGRQQLCDEKQNIQVQKIFFKLHKRAGFFFSLSLVWMTLTQNQIDFECSIHQNSINSGLILFVNQWRLERFDHLLSKVIYRKADGYALHLISSFLFNPPSKYAGVAIIKNVGVFYSESSQHSFILYSQRPLKVVFVTVQI